MRWTFTASACGLAAGAWLAAGWIVPLPAFALFSRIRRSEVLEHPARQGIVEAVTVQPGLTLQALQARMGVAWGTMVHHVRCLERHGRIVSVRQGPRRLLYAASTPHGRLRAALALLRNARVRAIAAAVAMQPGLAQVDVCHLTGTPGPAASKHLGRLTAAGLVEVERVGSTCRYRATPRLLETLELLDEPAVRPAWPEGRPLPAPRPQAGGASSTRNETSVRFQTSYAYDPTVASGA